MDYISIKAFSNQRSYIMQHMQLVEQKAHSLMLTNQLSDEDSIKKLRGLYLDILEPKLEEFEDFGEFGDNEPNYIIFENPDYVSYEVNKLSGILNYKYEKVQEMLDFLRERY